ncbi:hypothetical protein [Burkholderia multivorans]|uniref:hypothetical protein n=1 Tax=Burkholderia multivorans TaxID=87883 RepID=UPI0011B1FE88|nr:hypothetical protein [Burkholderia multivorans]
MTQPPLVPLEGALARPRATPLDDVPPFGREWTVRDVDGASPGKHFVAATLSTSCIDIHAPHRACRWQAIVQSTSADAVDRRAERIGRTRSARHERHAVYATCWTLGALAIIGSLIALRAPSTAFAPAPTVGTTEAVSNRAAPSTTAHGTVSTRRDSSAAAAAPVAAIIGSRQPANGATRAQPASRVITTPGGPHRVTPSRALRSSTHAPHRASRSRLGTAQTTPRAMPRVAALARYAVSTSSIAGTSTAASMASRSEPTLDDPLTLIAIANALRDDSSVRAMPALAADFDWTSQLSHRRLTDASPASTH